MSHSKKVITSEGDKSVQVGRTLAPPKGTCLTLSYSEAGQLGWGLLGQEIGTPEVVGEGAIVNICIAENRKNSFWLALYTQGELMCVKLR